MSDGIMKTKQGYWPMATTARLFEYHANQTAWEGPWEIKKGTDPALFKDNANKHFDDCNEQ